jgi:predicted transcriptional regulator of viral defense system
MNYLAFEKALREFPVLSIKDIKKRYPDFDNRRLVEWQQKSYIQKIRREFYCFQERKKDEQFLFFAANKIYSPSYVSMESALAFYNLIPEGVFLTTSISTRNTASFNTTIGDFSYNHIKPLLFFGYRLLQNNGIAIKIAEPEKVILDYLYLKKLNSEDDIDALRFNEIQIKEIVDFHKLDKYQNIFNSRVLDKRIMLLKEITNA